MNQWTGPLPIADRFWPKVDRSGDCWLWTASRNKAGYGQIGIDKRPHPAHRISWELHFGPIPPGMLVCHTCDNPPCVNPTHLFLGTDSDNAWDKVFKGRAPRGNNHPNRARPERLQRGDAHYSRRTPERMARKIPLAAHEQIRARAEMGEKRSTLAIEYGISKSRVQQIINSR